MNNFNIDNKIEIIQNDISRKINFDKKGIEKDYENISYRESLAIRIFIFIGSLLAFGMFAGGVSSLMYEFGETAMIIYGSILMIASYWLDRNKNTFIFESLELFLYLNGLVMINLGINEFLITEVALAINVLIALFSVFIYRNYFILFAASLIGLASFSSLVLTIAKPYSEIVSTILFALYLFILTYIYFFEGDILEELKKQSIIYNIVRLSLTLYILFMSFNFVSVFYNDYDNFDYRITYIKYGIIFIAIIYTLNYLLEYFNVKDWKYKIGFFVITGIVLIPTAVKPSISLSILILLMSFMINYKTGITLAIISLLYSLGMFYYDLNYTLLTKSIMLMTSGVFFIGVYFLAKNKIKTT